MGKKHFYMSIALLTMLVGLSGCSNGASSISMRIESIDSVDESSLESLHEIEDAYQALSDEEKDKVSNHAELKEAISRAEGMKNDREFLEALEDSVKNRMKQAGEEDDATLVNSELARLDDFRDCVHYDETISVASRQYISGLDAQKEALGKTENYSEYQVLWSKGLVDRYAALNSLYEKHDFMKGNANFKADYILSFEHEKKYYDAMVSIEADIVAQADAGAIVQEYFDNKHQLRVTLMNNTDYSFDTAFELDTYRDDGTVLETVQTTASAQPHSQYTAIFFVTDNTWSDANWNNWYNDIFI